MNTTNFIANNANIEIVDSNQDLTILYATIQNLGGLQSPESTNLSSSQEVKILDFKEEDELRRVRGLIIDNKTSKVIHNGSFFPYEFTEVEQEKCEKKMEELNHKLEDMNIEYSYEGTIIRIFYYKKWEISTHRKLDSGRSKWGSDKSFKFLFEKGLKESYDMSLENLFNSLNLRCQYTFMLMADENTRFVCTANHYPKKVYFVESNDNMLKLKVDTLAKPNVTSLKAMDHIFNYVKNMTYPYTHQGLLLVHKNGSQYRIISSEYAILFGVRNNEQSIPYRYLQLKTQNNLEMIKMLKKLFPQYNSTFDSYETYVGKLAEIIYKEYQLRKERSKLPQDLTTIQQIDQKIYLFIKNRLLALNNGGSSRKQHDLVTYKLILELLWLEEPSNLNHMIRMLKYNEKKYNEKQQTELVELQDSTPDTKVSIAAKKKKPKYTQIPIQYTCKKKLCF